MNTVELFHSQKVVLAHTPLGRPLVADGEETSTLDLTKSKNLN